MSEPKTAQPQAAQHGATVTWHLAPRAEFSAQHYNQDHEWTFPGGEVVPASSSPHYHGTASRVNPEEAVIASLASCHMLTFLALAAKKQFRVVSYLDRATAVLGKNEKGRMAITDITLRPRVVFDDDACPDEPTLKALHEEAHDRCFIANTLNARMTLEPEIPQL
ncbi:OsmC family protein [Alcanivorax sp. JB21]|uniref:OsmC family protein n=1 Tax=Alcanivorax limicola TaxID=2874102 RepID=UPI001CBEFC39|nr:OsmC family protein [Alcanivorax limicola]MBZ2189010.1 OsmC family protein [Alcanivorax limicola]